MLLPDSICAPFRCLMTKKKRYKRYSPEFKREALLRASEEGATDDADLR